MTTDIAAAMCPGAPRRNIEANLPHVLAALDAAGIGDAPMQLMAVATIHVECAGFAPLNEFVSHYNTADGGEQFALYGPGTRTGSKLGNTQPGDGARFRGRGFVQLTGRANYDRIGHDIGVDLLANPDAANEPGVAAQILAAYLRAHESAIRSALAARDFAHARKLVNGGTLGLAGFTESYLTGERMMSASA